MSTKVASDRKFKVDEILGAFRMTAGGTVTGVAYGGAFHDEASGPQAETRDPSTGEIIKKGIEALGKPLLFWRSFLQWLGGMGIVVLLSVASWVTVVQRMLFVYRATTPPRSPPPSPEPNVADDATPFTGDRVVR